LLPIKSIAKGHKKTTCGKVALIIRSDKLKWKIAVSKSKNPLCEGTKTRVIDNVTLVSEYHIPQQFHNSIRNREPYDSRGIIFTPTYRHGELKGYRGELNNLLICVYPNERIALHNSVHKYWHRNNHSDFYACEARDAIKSISDATGVDWMTATVKKLEYGCNILTNPLQAVDSLRSYKTKNFQPMTKNGLIYGASCEYSEYGLKGYNKTVEVGYTEKIKIGKPIFRWEIFIKKIRTLEKVVTVPLSVEELIKKETLRKLADDAIAKYKATLRMQQINLHKLSVHEQLVYAAMQIEPIRNNLKQHHRETFKKHKRLYKALMTNPEVVSHEDLEGLLIEKFDQLIDGVPTCSIVGKGGTKIPTDKILSTVELINNK